MPTSCFFPGIGGAQIGFHNLAKKLKELGHNPYSAGYHLIHINLSEIIIGILIYSILPMPPKIFGL